MSDAYLNYTESTGNIFRCHRYSFKTVINYKKLRELTELVPAVATEDVHYLKYEGMGIARHKVDQVRR